MISLLRLVCWSQCNQSSVQGAKGEANYGRTIFSAWMHWLWAMRNESGFPFELRWALISSATLRLLMTRLWRCAPMERPCAIFRLLKKFQLLPKCRLCSLDFVSMILLTAVVEELIAAHSWVHEYTRGNLITSFEIHSEYNQETWYLVHICTWGKLRIMWNRGGEIRVYFMSNGFSLNYSINWLHWIWRVHNIQLLVHFVTQ